MAPGARLAQDGLARRVERATATIKKIEQDERRTAHDFVERQAALELAVLACADDA